MTPPKSAAELAEEFAHKLTKDRSVFDGNDERIAIVSYEAGHAAGIAQAGDDAIAYHAQAPGVRELIWIGYADGETPEVVHSGGDGAVRFIEYAAYEALDARNKTLEELVKQDYDSTARDAQVIEALERELAAAKTFYEFEREVFQRETQLLTQARAELGAVERYRQEACSDLFRERERSAALVEALVQIELRCRDHRKANPSVQAIAREALKRYGGGE